MKPFFSMYHKPNSIDGTLYHYTSAESFFKILEDMTLKPSSMSNLNDLNEGILYRFLSEDSYKKIQIQDYISRMCTLLCFTKNYKYNNSIIERGTNHPAMWAHYANNSSGVCFVLDEEEFIKQNKQVLDNIFYKIEDVAYSGYLFLQKDLIRIKESSDCEEFVKKHYKDIFFNKHSDWKYEDERRLLMIGNCQKLTIKGCIKRIALGHNFVTNNEKMHKLATYMINPNYSCHKEIFPRSFSECANDHMGYVELEMSSFLYDILNNLNNESREYLRWEKDNFVIAPNCYI